VNGRVMLKQVLKKQCTLPWVWIVLEALTEAQTMLHVFYGTFCKLKLYCHIRKIPMIKRRCQGIRILPVYYEDHGFNSLLSKDYPDVYRQFINQENKICVKYNNLIMVLF
jgi:hypothetical protein